MAKIVIFYINNRDDVNKPTEMIKHLNSKYIDSLKADGYRICFIPTWGESTRIETIDLTYIDMKEKRNIIFYINTTNGDENIDKPIEIINQLNKDLLSEFETEGYQTCFVPTVDESTRVEVFNL